MFISNIPVYTFISNINTFAQEISGYLVWLHVHKSTLSIFNNEGKNEDIQAKISIIQACILKLKKNIPPFKVAKKIHKCNQYGSVTDHLLWHLPLWVKFVNNTLFYTKELLKSMFWAFSLPSDIFINTFPPTFNDLSIIASAHTQRRFLSSVKWEFHFSNEQTRDSS